MEDRSLVLGVGRIMTWARDLIIAAHDDPDDTMHAELTLRDITVISVALVSLGKEQPELASFINKLSHKLIEVGDAQEFL